MQVPPIILLLILAWNGVVFGAGFKVEEIEDGFTVSLQRDGEYIKIIEHTPSKPFLFVGKGDTTFKTHEGNVHISNYVHHKTPLFEFDIDNMKHSDEVIIHLYDSRIESCKVDIKLQASEQHQLEVVFLSFPTELYDRVWIRLASDAKEHLYGGGEQFTYFNLKGQKFQIWTREQGIGRNISSPLTFLTEHYGGGYGGDYHHTYFPQPTFISSRKFYCHVDGTYFTELDFTQESFHEVMILGRPSALYFNSDTTIVGVLNKLTSFLKRQPILADWVRDGVIIGLQGGTEKMLSTLETAEKHGISVSGLWIQDWAGKIFTSFGKRVFWNWEWNQEQYPGLDKEIKKLAKRGVRLLAYITAHMNIEGNLYKTFKDRDYFMKNSAGETYLMNFGEFQCASVDLTNEKARTWYKGIIRKNLIDFGFGGWMADFSEYIPLDGVFSNGETGATMHNKMPVLWAQTNREAVEEAGKLGEIMFFMRSGGAGTQAYSTMAWAGDQSVDFTYSDGLPSTIPAALSLGMSGFGLTHFDIGGYTTLLRSGAEREVTFDVKLIRTEELFMRGAEMAVFTPVMRTHEGNVPTLNFQIYEHPTAMKKFAVLIDMFRALAPYTKSLIEENTYTGLPLQRPLFLHYGNDHQSYDISYEYLYGRDLLIAPVVKPNVDKWDVYLPPDNWIYLFSEEKGVDDIVRYEGSQTIEIEAPLGRPPVFYRDGTKWIEIFKSVARIAKRYDEHEDTVKTEL